jgi:hypothetical protein
MDGKNRLGIGLLLLAISLMLAGPLLALDGKGRIVGRISGEDGKPVSQVLLVASSEGVVEDARSGPNGAFELEWLPPGTYTVKIKKAGYGELRMEAVEVAADEDTRIDPVLKSE